MYFAIGPSTKCYGQRQNYNEEEKKYLNKGCNIFEPGECDVWKEEDDQAGKEEDGDYEGC